MVNLDGAAARHRLFQLPRRAGKASCRWSWKPRMRHSGVGEQGIFANLEICAQRPASKDAQPRTPSTRVTKTSPAGCASRPGMGGNCCCGSGSECRMPRGSHRLERGNAIQAIELETKVQDGVVQLPAGAQLNDGQQVRVLLLYEGSEQAAASPSAEAAGEGAIARLLRNPLVVSGFEPLARDMAHER